MIDKDWEKADKKDFHIYRKGVWVLKEEVKAIEQLLREARRRLDRELEIEERHMSWWEYILYIVGLDASD